MKVSSNFVMPFKPNLSKSNNDNISSVQNTGLTSSKKDSVSFGTYYSAGRGQMPLTRDLAEHSLRTKGNANSLLVTANNLRRKAVSLTHLGDPGSLKSAKSFFARADQMIKDVQTETALFVSRQAWLSKF